MVTLADLGWDNALAAAFEPYAPEGLVPGRVTLEHTHIYRVRTGTGEVLARVAGRLRHHASGRVDFPAVGDWVALEPSPRGGDARIRAVLPRRSRFSRRAAGDPTEEQVVAANIDVVFLVTGLDDNYNLRRIERYLLVAWESGATPVVVLNKADLVSDPAERVEEVRALAPAVPVYAVSAHRSETLEPLRGYLAPRRTGALLGSSGVGKSTIVNKLIGHELLPTRDVRGWDSHGRHTTTARQLVVLPGSGILIDTPGMRELQLWETGDALSGAFAEIHALSTGCRFRDCRHRDEPGCAVRGAVDEGGLPAARLESFHKLQDEQAHLERQLDQRALIEQKRKGKILSKAARKYTKEKRGD